MYKAKLCARDSWKRIIKIYILPLQGVKNR